LKVSDWPLPRHPADFREGNYTLVEHSERRNRGLEVRRVTSEQQETVRRVLGYLFATEAEAAEFAKGETFFDGGEGPLRQAFSHKRIDGVRIYVYRSRAIP
jgi:hypothetical protein